MDTPPCAVCGQPLPAQAPFLFYKGRRWTFCSAACRLTFKRDAASLADRHPERGQAPYPEQPTPVRRATPFSGLLGVAPPEPSDRSEGQAEEQAGPPQQGET